MNPRIQFYLKYSSLGYLYALVSQGLESSHSYTRSLLMKSKTVAFVIILETFKFSTSKRLQPGTPQVLPFVFHVIFRIRNINSKFKDENNIPPLSQLSLKSFTVIVRLQQLYFSLLPGICPCYICSTKSPRSHFKCIWLNQKEVYHCFSTEQMINQKMLTIKENF